jgi:hypothetical protein
MENDGQARLDIFLYIMMRIVTIPMNAGRLRAWQPCHRGSLADPILYKTF